MVGLVVLTGFALTLTGFSVMRQLERTRAVDEFEREATSLLTAVVQGFEKSIDVIQSVGALYAASDVVTRDAFGSFVTPLLANIPSIQGLGWVPRVAATDRPTFEAAARTEFPDFQITERVDSGTMGATSRRDEYFPVFFLEPYLGNEAALGFDNGSDPTRLRALSRARDTGAVVSTSRIVLVQEREDLFSVLLLLPIYARDKPVTTLEQRRENLAGFVTAVLRIGDVAETALSPFTSEGVDVLICDEDAPLEERFLYARLGGVPQTHPSMMTRCTQPHAAGPRLRRSFEMAGRRWSILATPAPGFYRTAATWQSWGTLFLGLMFTVLLAGYLQLVQRRTFEIGVSNRLLSAEIVHRRRVEVELNEANLELARLAREDKLTGLANRRHFDEYLEQEWRQANRSGAPLSLILGDIDCFKEYNDRYGHAAGDICLKQIAGVLTKLVRRPIDLAARCGGEEFAVILPETAIQGAFELAERIRVGVRALGVPHDASEVVPWLTISLGVGTATLGERASMAEFVEAVDRALYQAKRLGRDRVVKAEWGAPSAPDRR